MVQKRLVIFAGAGASFATDKEQYPTTVGFRKRLPESVTSNHAFQLVESYLASVKNIQPPIDVEQVLWELQELDRFCVPLTTSDSFVSHTHSTSQIHLLGVNAGPQNQHQYAAIQSQIKLLIKDINRHVYDFYGKEPEPEKVNATWGSLLPWVNQAFGIVDIVTTNYDLVIESALLADTNSKTLTGRVPGLATLLDVELWKDSDREQGLLTKLHGSVDWQLGQTRGVDTIKAVGAEFHGNHDARVIIYPGYKDTPNNEPFTTFHEYFESRLSQATHVLVIGFAFRDEHINTIFRRAVTSSQRVCVVDPSLDALSRQYPFSPKPIVQNTGFGQGTAGGGLLSNPTPEGFNNQLRHMLLDA